MKKSALTRRSLVINGRRKTFSLEKEFWIGLQKIAKSKRSTAAILAKEIAKRSRITSLPSALRIYVYRHFRSPSRYTNSRSLRARAKEYRLLADRLKDAKSRKAIRVIARDYDRMAAKVERAPTAEAD
jgi:predicted DNA-binding ribbon-helix-helix protein